MAHARSQHPNAVMTPRGRERMVRCVLEGRWTIEMTAERFQVDAKTVRKWRDRFLAEGPAGLLDRSSRPHRCPTRTAGALRRRVLQLRRQHRWGADHIAHELGLAASTVGSILRAEGMGRLDRGDRATAAVLRYQRDHPGELIHVDVKKSAPFPTAVAGGSTDEATTATAATAGLATATSTPLSMTAPGWPTARSSPTNER